MPSKFIAGLAGLVSALIIFSSPALAVPTLQLDIRPGRTYDASSQTIMSTSPNFTLYALLNLNRYNTLSDTYFISAAVVPKVGPTNQNLDLGTFFFNGTNVNVTDDMVYGVPPIDTLGNFQPKDGGDLGKHDIFFTYFSEFGFQFSNDFGVDTVNKYDTQTLVQSSSGSLYRVAFDINTSGLLPGYEIHFDLYNESVIRNCRTGAITDIDISQFAPFSHDAQSGRPSTPVPEPGTMMLLGSGLIGLAGWGRKKFRK